MTPRERAARATIVRVPESEGYACSMCDPFEPFGPGLFIVDGTWPACGWHADETVHDAIEYGTNCSQCGVEHSPLWLGLLR